MIFMDKVRFAGDVTVIILFFVVSLSYQSMLKLSQLFFRSNRQNMSADMDLLKKIASNALKKVPNGETIEIQSLWKENTAVLCFIRRFGCPVCQYLARQISKLRPILDKHDIKLIGIGPEELGSKEFYEAKHLDGDVYYDPEKMCYKALGYNKYNMFNVLGGALSSKTRELANLASKEGLKGNFSGDLMQMGGVLVVKKGGEEILFNFKQQSAADHVENEKILQALGIQEKIEKSEDSGPSCNADACTL
ncbi:prostamide/prostaglandin F synthase-like [Styela clava]